MFHRFIAWKDKSHHCMETFSKSFGFELIHQYSCKTLTLPPVKYSNTKFCFFICFALQTICRLRPMRRFRQRVPIRRFQSMKDDKVRPDVPLKDGLPYENDRNRTYRRAS